VASILQRSATSRIRKLAVFATNLAHENCVQIIFCVDAISETLYVLNIGPPRNFWVFFSLPVRSEIQFRLAVTEVSKVWTREPCWLKRDLGS